MTTEIQILIKENAPEYITKAIQLYETAFPINERRPTIEWLNKIDYESAFQIHFIVNDKQQFLGFITKWDFDKFSYIEHFATEETIRGHGIGGKAIDMIQASMPGKLFILEVEPPDCLAAIRRIDFYKSHGFHLLDFNYMQPPYSPEKDVIPLKLMVNVSDIEKEKLNIMLSTIKRRVYGVKA